MVDQELNELIFAPAAYRHGLLGFCGWHWLVQLVDPKAQPGRLALFWAVWVPCGKVDPHPRADPQATGEAGGLLSRTAETEAHLGASELSP